MRPGRPPGTKNPSDHSAGGSRPGSGKKIDNKRSRGDDDLISSATDSQRPLRRPRTIETTAQHAVTGTGDQTHLHPFFNKRLRQPLMSAPDGSDQMDLDQPQADTADTAAFQFLDSVVPDTDLGFDDSDSGSDSGSDSEDDPLAESESHLDDLPVSGIVEAYLGIIKDRLVHELASSVLPSCYQQGTFWVSPPDAYFGLRNSANSPEGLAPMSLYYPRVFVWLPHLLDRQPLSCQNSACIYYQDKSHPLRIKGWNDNPVARRVVDLGNSYYIITQRLRCRKDNTHDGCGTTMNLYDPVILDQLDPGLASEFPAFLTHRSGIDKTLMTLLRAGIAHRVSSSAWSKILREIHVREHDLQELKYLHAIKKEKNDRHRIGMVLKSYEPFSAFEDHSGYCGFYPSRWFINNIYMDYMQFIRPVLDQCMAALPALIIKWDHSFKLPKYLMKLNGVQLFAALFTVMNEYEQVRWQGFVPTKSLTHIRAALEGIPKSLVEHGLPLPILGFTDNVGQDISTFLECIPSLAKDTNPVQLEEFADLPLLSLPEDVSVFVASTETQIQSICLNILEGLENDSSHIHIGFDMEWEFSTGYTGSGPGKTALVQIAVSKSVYLFQVYTLKKLPTSLKTLLRSEQIIKIGRNVGSDLAKLARDFPDFVLPAKKGKIYAGVIELGRLAAERNTVPNARASLATIAAATLQQHLSKETRTSSWGVPILSDSQKQYAALDAYVALQIWDVLKDLKKSGQPLSSATQVGQLVSLQIRKQEVAHGVIIEQPADYTIAVGPKRELSKINISSVKTRALIRIDKVLAPSCVIGYHQMSLEKIQNGQASFNAIVNISLLRTRSPEQPSNTKSILQKENRNIGKVTVIQPSAPDQEDTAISSLQNYLENESGNSSDSDSDTDFETITERISSSMAPGNYVQQEVSDNVPSRILADPFHIIDRVCRTISKKHTAHKKFATAFSDTLLIPDQNDKAAVQAALKKKNQTWEEVKAKSPAWLWRRVRRFIPEKDELYVILRQFFDCWRSIKCTVTGQKLFSLETNKKVQHVLLEVKKGWISDPSSIPIYTQAGIDKDGLRIYHCIRGTNSVEGAIHNPIRRNFASLNASPQLADAIIADFRHRHNVDSGVWHRHNVRYQGHYDPWLDHAIYKLRADIAWTTKPVSQRMIADTDPLDFAPTSEKFGITYIPAQIRSLNNYLGLQLEDKPEVSAIPETNLHLSRLSGGHKNMYLYLAKAQGTQYAVTPIHTKDEYVLFHEAVKVGGPWFPQNGLPNFDKMAYWWSTKSDGKTIFYKLREHLSAYYKIYKEYKQQQQTMVDSRPERQLHEQRIRSNTYTSRVLPAATRDLPGVLVTSVQQSDIFEDEPINEPLVIVDTEMATQLFGHLNTTDTLPIEAATTSSLSATQIWQMEPQTAVAASGYFQLANQTIVQPEALPSTSSSGHFQTLNWTENPHSTQASTSSLKFVTRNQLRRCKACMEAGRDGYDCPGANRRSKCLYRGN